MSDLTITLTGEVRESNFDEWKDDLVTRIRAVDVDLSADDDDLTAANESIRQFREAERTLKAAKQAALEQAADINRLFDAVDAVTEETRQARLGLERRIRIRRQELKQQSLQAHADANAVTLDALPAVHQALFQDRSTLLHLAPEALATTIEQRIGVWQSVQGRGDEQGASDAGDTRGGGTMKSLARADSADPHSDEPSPVDSDEPPWEVPGTEAAKAHGDAADVVAEVPPDDQVRAWRVTIELAANRTKADQLFTRVRDRWKTDRAVSGVELSPMDR